MPKAKNVLQLFPPDAEVIPARDNHLQLFDPHRALNHNEKRIVDEARTQVAVIEATTAKTEYGTAKIAEMEEDVVYLFGDTTGNIQEYKGRVRSEEHQQWVDQFIIHQIKAMGRHMSAAVEVGATSIGFEIHRSLYPPPEPPVPPEKTKPRSLREILFG